MTVTLAEIGLRRLIALLVSLFAAFRRSETTVEVPLSLEPARRSYGHDQGDDHLLERPRNTGRNPRGRSGRRDIHRARAFAWSRWQRLQGPGVESPPRHAVGLR